MVMASVVCLALTVGCDKEKDNERQTPGTGTTATTDTIPTPGVDTIPAPGSDTIPTPETRAAQIQRWLYGTWELQQARYLLFFSDTTSYEEFPWMIDDQYRWVIVDEPIYKECIVSDETEIVNFSYNTVYFSQQGGYQKPYDIEEDGVVVIDRGTEYHYERAYPGSARTDYRLHGIRVYVADSNNLLMYNYTPYKTVGDSVVRMEYPISYHFVKIPKEPPRPCPFGMGCL